MTAYTDEVEPYTELIVVTHVVMACVVMAHVRAMMAHTDETELHTDLIVMTHVVVWAYFFWHTPGHTFLAHAWADEVYLRLKVSLADLSSRLCTPVHALLVVPNAHGFAHG